MCKILDRQLSKEVAKSAEKIDIDRHPVERVVAHLAQTVRNLLALEGKTQLLVASTGALEHIAEMWATVLLCQLFAQGIEAVQDARDLQVRRLLGPVATGMRQRQIRSVVLADGLQRHHVIDIQRGLLHGQVDGLFTDEAMSALRTMQLLDKRHALVGAQVIEKL